MCVFSPKKGICGLAICILGRKFIMLLWHDTAQRYQIQHAVQLGRSRSYLVPHPWQNLSAGPKKGCILISSAVSSKYLSFLTQDLFRQIKAKGTLMQMVAADWISSDKREDDLSGRPRGIVQVSSKSFLEKYCLIICLSS